MPKQSQIERQKRRQKTVAKYAAQRLALKKAGDYQALAKLPRDASPTRLKNRCQITGRAHGYMRKYGISRICFREMAHHALIPGVTKSSW